MNTPLLFLALVLALAPAQADQIRWRQAAREPKLPACPNCRCEASSRMGQVMERIRGSERTGLILPVPIPVPIPVPVEAFAAVDAILNCLVDASIDFLFGGGLRAISKCCSLDLYGLVSTCDSYRNMTRPTTTTTTTTTTSTRRPARIAAKTTAEPQTTTTTTTTTSTTSTSTTSAPTKAPTPPAPEATSSQSNIFEDFDFKKQSLEEKPGKQELESSTAAPRRRRPKLKKDKRRDEAGSRGADLGLAQAATSTAQPEPANVTESTAGQVQPVLETSQAQVNGTR